MTELDDFTWDQNLNAFGPCPHCGEARAVAREVTPTGTLVTLFCPACGRQD